MTMNSEYCQRIRKYAVGPVSIIVSCMFTGNLTGCSNVQSHDLSINDTERLAQQAELKASLLHDDLKQVDPPIEQSSFVSESEEIETTEAQAVNKKVAFTSLDFSRYADEFSSWFSDPFTWSSEKEDNKNTEPENSLHLEAPSVAKASVAELSPESDTNIGHKSRDEENKMTAILSVLEAEQTKEASAQTSSTAKELLVLSASNETLIAAINTLTEEQPSAAGIPLERVEQQVGARMMAENKTKESKEAFTRKIKAEKLKAMKVWQGCLLPSPTIELDGPTYTTQLWLNVFDDRLMVNATTNIDITLNQVGVKIDNGKLQKFSDKLYASNVVWSADMNALFQNHKTLQIFIGGDELGRIRQSAVVSIAELKSLYLANANCSN